MKKSDTFKTDDMELMFLADLKSSISFNTCLSYRSKINPLFIYDNAPANMEKFDTLIQFEAEEYVLNYILYLCEKRLEDIEKLSLSLL